MTAKTMLHLTLITICAAGLAACGSDDDVRIEFEPDSPAGSAIELKLNMQPGATSEVRASFDMDMEMQIDGEDAGMKTAMEMGFTLNCEKVDSDGISHVKATYSAISMDMDISAGNNNQRMKYDSRTGRADPPQLSVLGNMVGKSIVMRMRPNGSIAGLDGLNDLIREVGGSSGGQDPEAMFKSLEQMTMFFPDRPVDNGDTWTRTIETELPAPMKLDLECVLLSHDANSAVIGINGELKMTGMPGNSDVSSANVSGTMGGKATVDLRTGFTTAMDLKMRMTGEMRVKGQDVELEATVDTDYQTD